MGLQLIISQCEWACSQMVGQPSRMLPTNPSARTYSWIYSKIFRRYALSGKRRSRRGVDDKTPIVTSGISISAGAHRVGFAFLCSYGWVGMRVVSVTLYFFSNYTMHRRHCRNSQFHMHACWCCSLGRCWGRASPRRGASGALEQRAEAPCRRRTRRPGPGCRWPRTRRPSYDGRSSGDHAETKRRRCKLLWWPPYSSA
jgi:hypothetical protein